MIRDSSDRKRTLIDMSVDDLIRERAQVVPLERQPENGVYRGRAKVRVLPPGAGTDDEAQVFVFGKGARKSGAAGRAKQAVTAAERRKGGLKALMAEVRDGD